MKRPKTIDDRLYKWQDYANQLEEENKRLLDREDQMIENFTFIEAKLAKLRDTEWIDQVGNKGFKTGEVDRILKDSIGVVFKATAYELMQEELNK